MYKFLFSILFCLFFQPVASQDVLSADRQLKSRFKPADTIQSLHYSDLGWVAIYAGKYDSALYYLDRSLEIAKALNFKRCIVSYSNARATIYWYQGENIKAMELFEVALKEAKEIHSKRGISMIYAGMALVYRDMGNMPKSLEANLLSLKYAEETQSKMGIASSLANIGMVFADMKKPYQAIPYYERAIVIFKEIGDTLRLGATYNDFSTVYEGLLQYDKALACGRLALMYSQAAHNPDVEASAHNNIGVNFLDTGYLDSALWHMQQSIRIREELQDPEGIIPCLVNVGVIYEKKGHLQEGIKYMEQAVRKSYAIGVLHYIASSEKKLSDLLQKTGNYKAAFEHYEKYTLFNDSIYNEENAAKLVKAEMNYEFEKKQAAVRQEQVQRDAAAELARKKQLLVIWIISGLLCLLIVIAILVVRQVRYRNKQREMQLEQKLLRSQMNPHFIFNSLQAIQNFILKHNEKDAVRYLGSFASITRSVLENSRLELIPVRKELSLLENYLQLQKLRFGNAFEYAVHVDETLDAEYTYIPPMLSQPFIENALEHGMSKLQSGGLIEIRFRQDGDYVCMEITDNGFGMTADKEGDKKHVSLATTITKERVELMNKKSKTKITFTISDAYPGAERKGVRVVFRIPLTGML